MNEDLLYLATNLLFAVVRKVGTTFGKAMMDKLSNKHNKQKLRYQRAGILVHFI